MDEGEVATGVLIEAGEHATEVFEFADETLDKVALHVGRVVAATRIGTALSGWDGRSGMQLLLDIGNRRISIIPAISKDFLRLLPGEQRERLRVVARRATRQDKFQRIAQRIDEDMDLRAEATARAP